MEVTLNSAEQVEIKTLAQAITTIVGLRNEIAALHANLDLVKTRVEALETKPAPAKTDGREMTDDDARAIMFGDHAALKHKDAAEKLGLSYGQVYSCRLGFTFKSIHKEMKEKGVKNQWIK